MAYYQIALRLLLSFVIAVSPIILINSANAANVGGWTLGGGVAQGASTVYDATKNVLINGKKFIKESSVKITPNASQVAKVLARGAAGYALSVAVEQLLGSVDWVLDPENNRIIYDGSPTGYIYTIVSYGGKLNVSSPDYTSACKKAIAAFITIQSSGGDTYTTSNMQASPTLCTFDYHIKQYTYSERLTITQTEVNEEPKSLPLEVVAAQVISNAESDTEKRPAAQVATTAAAADIVAEAEKDDSKARPIASQAEANATTKPADAAEAENAGEAAGTSKPNTTNPEITDISLEFPIFCNWAPTVCEAAQTVISFPRTLTDWWNTSNEKADSWVMSITEAWASVRDWATTEKQNDSTEIEIEKPQQETVDTDISFNASCPAPYTLASFTAFGSSHNWTIDFSEMCSAITTFVRPVVIAMGALSAALIIGGVRDNG